jgi:type IV pilus assembly protein PilB
MLGERLLANGAITASQLQVALEDQRRGGSLLGETLLTLNFVSEEALSTALAQEAGVRFVVLDGMHADPAAIALVPEAFARQHLIAPLRLKDALLEVLQANPFDVIALDELARQSGHRVSVMCGTRSDVLRLIERSYGERDGASTGERTGRAAPVTAGRSGGADDSSAAGLIERLLGDAVRRAATDLLIEPGDKVVRLRYRVDGALTAGETVSKELHLSLVSRMKQIAGLDSSEQRMPQDGRVSHTIAGRRVDLRISTFPTVFGEKVAVRVFERDRLVRDLGDLGLAKRNLALLVGILGKPRGLVLVTGLAGAGRTTTVYSALTHIGGRDKAVLTLEDPVECELPSICQTEVAPNAGLTFASGLRSLLRENPDVVMIGEIRDQETVRLALRAALSGVLVLTTLAAADATGAVQQLSDMAADPSLVALGLSAVLAQRLVRVICPDCRRPATYPPEVLAGAGLNADPGVTFYKGKGCEQCRAGGYRGRTGVFEILSVDATIQALIRERVDPQILKAAAADAGMKTLREDALQKAIFGQTTIEEVLRVACE